MSIDRRVNAQSRRRRVLYQTTRELEGDTAADRRATERLREARKPTASYGARVNRRLRGRWFSLVPVTTGRMTACALAVLGSALLLVGLHWAAVAWNPLASNEPLARPFRLDRTDSFGTWLRTCFLAASAGTGLLIYQLRRYKIDDYKGQYRLWRPVIILLAVMSVDTVTNLIPWCGAVIDTVLGKRMALTGADWLRIVILVGGSALALRLLVEIHRSKLSLVMMIGAVIGVAILLLSRWNLIDATTMSGWLTITSTPLLAAAAVWISLGAYLRLLFREVRGLDNRLSAAEEATPAKLPKAATVRGTSAEEASEETGRGWFWKRSEAASAPRVKAKPSRASEKPQPSVSSREKDAEAPAADPAERKSWFRRKPKLQNEQRTSSTPAAQDENPSVPADAKPSQRTKRFMWLRAGKQKPNKADSAEPTAPRAATTSKAPVESKDTAAKRGWFSRFKRSADPATKGEGSEKTTSRPVATARAANSTTSATKPGNADPGSNATAEAPARRGLGGWLRRDSGATPVPSAAESSRVLPTTASTRPASSSAAAADQDDDDESSGGDDDVDWGSMNKTERRRMRKEMKRSGRAA